MERKQSSRSHAAPAVHLWTNLASPAAQGTGWCHCPTRPMPCVGYSATAPQKRECRDTGWLSLPLHALTDDRASLPPVRVCRFRRHVTSGDFVDSLLMLHYNEIGHTVEVLDPSELDSCVLDVGANARPNKTTGKRPPNAFLVTTKAGAVRSKRANPARDHARVCGPHSMHLLFPAVPRTSLSSLTCGLSPSLALSLLDSC